MSLGPWQLVIIAILILVLFGRGRISEMMGDFGKGIKSFKQGMNEEETKPAKQISHDAKPADEGLTEDQVKKPSESK
ncbi:MAG: twin-arginine translocase TatA/TatE family subunit [Altererythrobacter sp.]|nr:twin-arginine translocase TatA/TatE family subunit [Erythrobacter sp.]MAW90720.1 twin-arginine translocase TatA/TatE family subunit [Altererythrobacter sp.]MBK61384.1 twin-arginine translocase TatA/TatE family subunit [Altererythrobacter sp.]|tara:strand:- start:341 stop:571 length:231 start_codon:yes stop_codon:yes gene_type:complete